MTVFETESRHGTEAGLARLVTAGQELGASAVSDEPETFLATAARALADVIVADHAAIFRVDDRMLVLAGTSDPSDGGRPDRQASFIDDYPVARHVVATHRPRVVSLGSEESDGAETALLRELGMHSVAVLPIASVGHTWGVGRAYRSDARAFGDDDLRAATVLLRELGTLLSVRETAERSHQLYYEVLSSLANAFDVDEVSRQERLAPVVELSRDVAVELGLDGDLLRSVELGALLHDIGMVRLPDAVLKKRGVLDADERRLIERHTIIGEAILAPISGLNAARSIVRSHHEWWNGEGYPDRLRGEEIPLGARIVAVADVFCALTDERPYRSALSASDALDEIENYAGVHFDPRCVAALRVVLGGTRRDASPVARGTA